MGLIDQLTEFAKVLPQLDNLPMMRQLVTIQAEAMALIEENRALKDRLKVLDELTFRDDAYWRGQSGPYCSRCWDVTGKLVRLHGTDGESYPTCPACSTTVNRGAGPALA